MFALWFKLSARSPVLSCCAPQKTLCPGIMQNPGQQVSHQNSVSTLLARVSARSAGTPMPYAAQGPVENPAEDLRVGERPWSFRVGIGNVEISTLMDSNLH